ncbi:serine--tRNA ligase, mitochondrial-like [Gigantopelta aegis]|uniref:serine--tRNA ligase, mitochondrial-like n=1 Tax=Gigantopelta aegis TaxID=1735272 RepID=UPI001B88A26D|nr:serine--tRNA ligase, mitochondrial-like [Gigantopelta aegis]XP_041352394.1 serine--tRNA ligase, mitochondrial-like [Gigantopelta aegis]
MAIKQLLQLVGSRALRMQLLLISSSSFKPTHALPCSSCHHRRIHTTKSQLTCDPQEWSNQFHLEPPELDFQYLCDESKAASIKQNILNRKGIGDLDKVHQLWRDYHKETNDVYKNIRWQELLKAASEIPNSTHPQSPMGEESNANLVEIVGDRKEFQFKPKTVVQLGEDLDLLRTDNVSLTTGHRTYYLKRDLAKMEQALVRFTLDNLIRKGFQLVSVPDMIHPKIIESCGFNTTGERTQVYRLDPDNHGDVCLAGTSEMPLAGYFVNELLKTEQLPVRLTAVSRCYRAETSELQEEKGIYRVHQFTKVEMFAVTNSLQSGEMLKELLSIEKELFTKLGLHFRILDMPTEELGAPAYKKFDIEAWMPAKEFWGEISSCSNCTDFQSRRLHIKHGRNVTDSTHVHTVNGTACAVPRMIMAILENNQQQDGTILIPEALHPYMNCSVLRRPEHPHTMKFIKSKKLKTKK